MPTSKCAPEKGKNQLAPPSDGAPELDYEGVLSYSTYILQMVAPFFASVVLSMDRKAQPGLNSVATDGKTLYYDPAVLRRWSPENIAAVLLHNIMHVIREHVFPDIRPIGGEEWARDMAVEHQADSDTIHIINGGKSLMNNWKLPDSSHVIQALADKDQDMTVEEIYKWILQNNKNGQSAHQGKPGCGLFMQSPESGRQPENDSNDDKKDDDKDEEGGRENGGENQRDSPKQQGHQPSADGNWCRIIASKNPEDTKEVRDRIAGLWTTFGSSQRGMMPDGLMRELDELVKPAVDWRVAFRRFTHFILNRDDRSYQHLNWKHPLALEFDMLIPGRRGMTRTVNKLVIAIDSSGSVWDYIEYFVTELAGMLKAVEDNVVIIVCDAAVQDVFKVSNLTDLLRKKNRLTKGGGGTSHCPVFDEIKKRKIRPSAVICLTDGYTAFPSHRPDCRVLWAVPDNAAASSTFPWGEVVRIPEKQFKRAA